MTIAVVVVVVDINVFERTGTVQVKLSNEKKICNIFTAVTTNTIPRRICFLSVEM